MYELAHGAWIARSISRWFAYWFWVVGMMVLGVVPSMVLEGWSDGLGAGFRAP